MKTYTYRCQDCIENFFDSVEALTVEAPNKREADKIARASNRIDTTQPAGLEINPYGFRYEVVKTPTGKQTVVHGSKWKLRGDNEFTAKGWVGPYCNSRVEDMEHEQRVKNLRGW